MIKHLVLSAGFLLAAVLNLCAADGPAAKLVPADAAWNVQADFEQFRQTQAGQALLKELEQTRLVNVFEGLKAALNFDPRQDLLRAAVFGWEFGEDNIVIVAQGKFDAEKLEALVTANKQYQAERHGEITIHGWEDARKAARGAANARTYAAIFGKDTVVVGPQAALVRNTLDVLGKPALSLAGKDKSAALADAGSVFLSANASKIKLPQIPPQAEVVAKEIKTASATLAEAGGKLALQVNLGAATEETARNFRDILLGLKAVLVMLKDRPQVAELASAVTVGQTGSQATLQFKIDAEDAVALVKKLIGQRRGRQTER